MPLAVTVTFNYSPLLPTAELSKKTREQNTFVLLLSTPQVYSLIFYLLFNTNSRSVSSRRSCFVICARLLSVYEGAALHVYAQGVPRADGAQDTVKKLRMGHVSCRQLLE